MALGVVDEFDDLDMQVDLRSRLIDGDVAERVLPAVKNPGCVFCRFFHPPAEKSEQSVGISSRSPDPVNRRVEDGQCVPARV